ncbi:unnamed protein product [Bursaphelenchus okinawaensis]|uniref:Vacuolar protein-sorting-associated protein 25 n=1 Tax=Bursaphelenchus okinawaensis TaxID=465554 RepID=A0A811JU47_9BILA|nr:unnamed protein product [Bursaphelenchus okinawaensis]CAG9083124.1 unnamed protein product [Bursaphelenchus okinawaensis]
MSFQWPWHFDFPPFFTIQPNLETRERQLQAWGQLVIDYCQYNKIFIVDIVEYRKSELFCNFKINRNLDEDGIQAVFDYLEKQKHVEWIDNTRKRCHIFWRRVDEWAQLLHDWAVGSGLVGTVLTFSDITEDEGNRNESFYNLDQDVLLKSLAALEQKGKAQLIDIGGVKGVTSNSLPQSFVNNNDFIKEGDEVLIYCDSDNIVAVTVKRGITVNMKAGALRHEFLIGKRYGTKLSATAGQIYALRPFPAVWTKVLKRHTQILYSQEVSMIVNLLDIVPGDIVCESGTGSGSLTHALAIAVGPSGKVYTHDIEQPQVDKIQKEAKKHGLGDRVIAALRDVTVDGFQVEGGCSAVFLDLPAPYLAVKNAMKAMDRSRICRLVSFSPCIEQSQELCNALTDNNFINIKTIELLGTTYKAETPIVYDILDMERSKSSRKTIRRNANNEIVTVEDNTTPNNDKRISALTASPDKQPTHAGFLTSATLLSI